MKKSRFPSTRPATLTLLALCSLVIILTVSYAQTLAPDLTWANAGADGGDLITAAATRGVPHPSGYPLYLLLARLFQEIPWGTLAWRTNFMSAVFAVLAVTLLFRHVERSFDCPSAWLTALLFGLSPLLWSQAVITEVYSLHVFLAGALLYCYRFVAPSPKNSFFEGTLLGLAAGNHLTILILAPILLWKGGGKAKLFRLSGMLAGISIYGLLPLHARSGSPVNWGNPVTLQSLLWLVSGSLYQPRLGNLSMIEIVERLRGWAGILLNQFSPVGVLVGFYGLLSPVMALQRKVTLWIFFAFSLVSVLYATPDSYLYLLPAVLVFAWWVGGGLYEIKASFLQKFPQTLKIALFSLIALTLWMRAMFVTLPQVNASQDDRAVEFAEEVLSQAPPEAILVADTDREVFTIWYFHFALGKRPDVRIVAEGLLPFEWYQQTLRNTYPDLRLPSQEPATVAALLMLNADRAVCLLNETGKPHLTCTGYR
jgi:hypothetical protein